MEDGITFFSKYVTGLAAPVIMRRRVLFTGVLGRSHHVQLQRRSVTEIILRYMRPAEYLFIKGLGRKIAPRWAA
jgi:hypothetical protein